MPRYVTESGYEEFEEVRTRVGRNAPLPHTLWLVDMATGEPQQLDFGVLPAVNEDPMAGLRTAVGQKPLKGHRAVRDRKSTPELQSLMRSSYAVFCLKKKKTYTTTASQNTQKRQE